MLAESERFYAERAAQEAREAEAAAAALAAAASAAPAALAAPEGAEAPGPHGAEEEEVLSDEEAPEDRGGRHRGPPPGTSGYASGTGQRRRNLHRTLVRCLRALQHGNWNPPRAG